MLTIIFILSLFSIAAIISWKMIEEKKSKMFFFSNLRKCADEAVEKTVNGAKNRFSVLNKKMPNCSWLLRGIQYLTAFQASKEKLT